MDLRKSIEEDISQLIKEKLEIDFCCEGTDFVSKSLVELGISSLDSITILIALEERYNVEFDEMFQTIEELIGFIEKKVCN